MKSSVKNAVIVFFVVVIILGSIYLLFLSGKYVIGLILSLEKEVAAAIIASSGTILASVAAILISQNRSKRREIEEAQRPNKIAAYKKFMEMMIAILKKGKEEEDFLKDGTLPRDMEDLFFSLQSDMIVWASPLVIRAYDKFKRYAQDANTSPRNMDILLYWDDILRHIRKDLGHKNTGLKRGDLIKLFLRDPQEFDRLTST